MNKKILVILLLFFFKTFSQSTNFGDSIKGKVKKYKEVWYKAKRVEKNYIKLDKLHYDTYVKDENNEFIKENLFPPTIDEMPKNIYNKNKSKIKTINYYSDGKILNTKHYKYIDGKLSEELVYNSYDSIISKKKYFYRNKLKIKEIHVRYMYGMFKTTDTTRTTFEYDNKSNLKKWNFYSKYDTHIEKYNYNDKKYLTDIFYSFNNIDFELSHHIKYVKYDNYNWTSLFFEKGLKSDQTNQCYYIEREFFYE